MKKLALATMFVATTAGALTAEEFHAHVARADAVEETTIGSAYQSEVWPVIKPFMTDLLNSCLPREGETDMSSFVFVADLTHPGLLLNIEVRPETAISKCFAIGMQRAPFPILPDEYGDETMPITFKMHVHRMNAI